MAIALIFKLILSDRDTTAQQEKTREQIKYERSIILIPEWDEFDSEYILVGWVLLEA